MAIFSKYKNALYCIKEGKLAEMVNTNISNMDAR